MQPYRQASEIDAFQVYELALALSNLSGALVASHGASIAVRRAPRKNHTKCAGLARSHGPLHISGWLILDCNM